MALNNRSHANHGIKKLW